MQLKIHKKKIFRLRNSNGSYFAIAIPPKTCYNRRKRAGVCVVLLFWILFIALTICLFLAVKYAFKLLANELESFVLQDLNFPEWNVIPYFDVYIPVKSRKALDSYDAIRYFKENREKLPGAQRALQTKLAVYDSVSSYLQDNPYKHRLFYRRVQKKMNGVLRNASAYRIRVDYISTVGNHLGIRDIPVSLAEMENMINDPTVLMGKGEYSKYLREQNKELTAQKQHDYYTKVNQVIDLANENRELLVNKNHQAELDNLISKLLDRTVNAIKRTKTVESEEWNVIDKVITQEESAVGRIVQENREILDYYASPDFQLIRGTCYSLMQSQKDFNAYIGDKVRSISTLFGTRVTRNETVVDDEYNYIRPYTKTITPFTAEVSAAVFSSAENQPLDYVVKYFYPDKNKYPEQIQKLQLLVEELQTLREAKQIIENYKKDYQQYLQNVPAFIMERDEDGFYSRLGFANVDEQSLTVEYKFIYTSGGGMAQRYFTVPMTNETIIALIEMLESKLTAGAFAKEQRVLMTPKLRESIKERDHYTCCNCGNSTLTEPNLLLEIDHIIPVSKGGLTEESNLQTLCWKCNRSKGNKILQ